MIWLKNIVSLSPKIRFEEQAKAVSLCECEDEWFHKTNTKINIKNDFANT